MWLFVLVIAAGLTLQGVLPVQAGWTPLVSFLLAYVAGRKLASLARAVWAFTAVAAAGLVIAIARFPDPLAYWSGVALVEFLAAVLPWWAGRYQRLNAERREREHGIVAEQARMRERARIAQDMHDSLGHELALIALHGGALEIGDGLTGEQRRSAGALRESAVRATERLHDLVRVLGSSDAAAGLEPPGESLTEVVRRAAAAGLPVRLDRDTPEPGWPPLTAHAAHRVVREALTNAARHAPGATVTVTIAPGRVEVANEPAPVPPGHAGAGQGLIGLDERVRLAGGDLTAGPLPGGGWLVAASFDGQPVPGRTTAFDTTASRRITRRRLVQTAALPAGILAALIATLIVAQGLNVGRTGLAHDDYRHLTIGEPRTAVREVLPPRQARGPVRLIAEPPPPAGSFCEYYHAGDALTDTAPRVYRLCFANGVLVAKNRFERA